MAAFHQLSMHIVPPRSNVREARLKLKFHGTETDTDTDMDFLADLSADFCPTRAFPREYVRWGCACTVHDKLSCTRLQNYTIGEYLMSVLVSVSVPWGSSFTERWARC